jgi:uncharacterized LabA/DUF88 family protein
LIENHVNPTTSDRCDAPLSAVKRVFVYIDGFNLYHGMREAGFRRYYWLNLLALASSFIKPGHQLVRTKYFTAAVSGPKPWDHSSYAKAQHERRRRQTNYFDALRTLPNLQLVFGKYQDSPKTCLQCGVRWIDHNEKMTDVNIATAILLDAIDDRFDLAILISGDSDLVPPVKAVRERMASKRVVIAFPPHRKSVELQKAAHGVFHINEAALKSCQFPDKVPRPDGFLITRPDKWR